MHFENLTYAKAVGLEQNHWRKLRKNGLRSLTVRHQNFEIPVIWSRSLEDMMLQALPVSDVTRNHIKTNHQPLLMGWALGMDHRQREMDQRPVICELTTQSQLANRHKPDFLAGVTWTHEILTGRATRDTLETIRNTQPSDRRARLLSWFLDKKYAVTATELPQSGTQFNTLLDDPAVRTALYDSWFCGNTNHARSQIKRYTGFDLETFTLRLGRSGSYTDKRKSDNSRASADSGEYIVGTGIAYTRIPILWNLPILLGISTGFLSIHPPKWYSLMGALLTTLYTGVSFREIYPFPVTALGHESIHSFAEGEGHSGWFPVQYKHART